MSTSRRRRLHGQGLSDLARRCAGRRRPSRLQTRLHQRQRPQTSRRPRRTGVADYLGNTPTVARASYIDSRIIELYERGITIDKTLADLGKGRDFGELATRGDGEKAVLKLLTDHF
jgi:DNA topoisomerase IB